METRGAFRGGNRGANRGGRVEGDRPQTSTYDRRPYIQKKKEGEEVVAAVEGAEGTKKEGAYQRKPIDENTWYYRYFYEARPKHDRTEVTQDTIVPPTVPKDARKKLPDQKDFDKKMKDLDTKIESLKEKIVSSRRLIFLISYINNVWLLTRVNIFRAILFKRRENFMKEAKLETPMSLSRISLGRRLIQL
jgi:hypothetical protein